MLKETLHVVHTRIKLAGNWSLSSDPEVRLTPPVQYFRTNQGLNTTPAETDEQRNKDHASK